MFFIKQQAFNRTTLVLRREMSEQSFHGFDVLISTECENEIRKIIASEIVKKYSVIFSMAISAHFTKFNIDGGIEARVLPCFVSKQRYINNVSEYCTRDIIHSSILDIKSRFVDFNERGSGWTLKNSDI